MIHTAQTSPIQLSLKMSMSNYFFNKQLFLANNDEKSEKKNWQPSANWKSATRIWEMEGRLWCRRLVVQLSSATFVGFFSKVSKNREKRLISDDTRASSSVAQGVGGFTVNQDIEGSTLTRNQSFLQVQQPRSKPPTARRNGSSVAASG